MQSLLLCRCLSDRTLNVRQYWVRKKPSELDYTWLGCRLFIMLVFDCKSLDIFLFTMKGEFKGKDKNIKLLVFTKSK